MIDFGSTLGDSLVFVGFQKVCDHVGFRPAILLCIQFLDNCNTCQQEFTSGVSRLNVPAFLNLYLCFISGEMCSVQGRAHVRIHAVYFLSQ
jgi:hypothetical protein